MSHATYTPDAAVQAAANRREDETELELARADAALDREEQDLAEDLWAIEYAAEDALEARRDADRDERGAA